MMTTYTFILISRLLGWTGIALLAFLIVRRSPFVRTTKRRCPKCWYDMSHSEGLTCAECGRTQKRERRLRRYRPARRFALLAWLLLIGAYALRVTPDVRARGWPAAVPMPVLLLLLTRESIAVPSEIHSMNASPKLTVTRASFPWPASGVFELQLRARDEAPLGPWVDRLAFRMVRLVSPKPRHENGLPFTFSSDAAWAMHILPWKDDADFWGQPVPFGENHIERPEIDLRCVNCATIGERIVVEHTGRIASRWGDIVSVTYTPVDPVGSPVTIEGLIPAVTYPGRDDGLGMLERRLDIATGSCDRITFEVAITRTQQLRSGLMKRSLTYPSGRYVLELPR